MEAEAKAPLASAPEPAPADGARAGTEASPPPPPLQPTWTIPELLHLARLDDPDPGTYSTTRPRRLLALVRRTLDLALDGFDLPDDERKRITDTVCESVRFYLDSPDSTWREDGSGLASLLALGFVAGEAMKRNRRRCEVLVSLAALLAVADLRALHHDQWSRDAFPRPAGPRVLFELSVHAGLRRLPEDHPGRHFARRVRDGRWATAVDDPDLLIRELVDELGHAVDSLESIRAWRPTALMREVREIVAGLASTCTAARDLRARLGTPKVRRQVALVALQAKEQREPAHVALWASLTLAGLLAIADLERNVLPERRRSRRVVEAVRVASFNRSLPRSHRDLHSDVATGTMIDRHPPLARLRNLDQELAQRFRTLRRQLEQPILVICPEREKSAGKGWSRRVELLNAGRQRLDWIADTEATAAIEWWTGKGTGAAHDRNKFRLQDRLHKVGLTLDELIVIDRRAYKS